MSMINKKWLTISIMTVLLLFGADDAMAQSKSKTTSPEDILKKSKTILILGDSITQAGSYVINFDAWLVKNYPKQRFTVINAGVSSETISGIDLSGTYQLQVYQYSGDTSYQISFNYEPTPFP